MEKLISAMQNINITVFPYLNFNSLTQYVTSISRELLIPYSAYKTDLERRYLKYRCPFHKNNQGDGCNACLVFRTDLINMQKAYSFVLEKSILTHNHPLTPNFVFSHRNCIPLEIQDKIREQQEIGVLPGRIRSNLNIIVNKNIFYNIRHPIICKDRTENFNELIHKITQSINQ